MINIPGGGLQSQVRGVTVGPGGQLSPGAEPEAPDFSTIVKLVMSVRQHEQEQELARQRQQQKLDLEHQRQTQTIEAEKRKWGHEADVAVDERKRANLDAEEERRQAQIGAFPEHLNAYIDMHRRGLPGEAMRFWNQAQPGQQAPQIPGLGGGPVTPGPVPKVPPNQPMTPEEELAHLQSEGRNRIYDPATQAIFATQAQRQADRIAAEKKRVAEETRRRRELNLESVKMNHQRVQDQAESDAEAEAAARAPFEAKREARAKFIQKRLEASSAGAVTPQFMAALNAEADLAYGPGGGGPEDVISAMQESSRKMLEGLKNRKR